VRSPIKGLCPGLYNLYKPERPIERRVVIVRNDKHYPNEQEGTATSYTERGSLCLPFYTDCIIIEYTYKKDILMNWDEFWQIIQLFASRTKGGEF